MFTGLVEAKGIIKSKKITQEGARFVVDSSFNNLTIGESIAINGACHTVVEIFDSAFAVDTMCETLNRTNLGKLVIGDIVNLERAMLANSRFAGHIVTGHIDGCAKLISKRQDGISFVYKFEYPDKYIVQKGSICVNGVSLTVSNVGANFFEVSLIPHTFENTNLFNLKIGDFVNIENDILAKYIEKFSKNSTQAIDENYLTRCGF
ncbi:MAG: riboflavin synthase [Cyanobacteria bacterium SIG30]|nr:riboflavin synthase [Cyanobacteria bacterium SIG30]